MFDEPKHTARDTASKLAIRLYELKEINKSLQSPEIFERIQLKEQLLNELRDYLDRRNKEAK
jgi:hypothetical protein